MNTAPGYRAGSGGINGPHVADDFHGVSRDGVSPRAVWHGAGYFHMQRFRLVSNHHEYVKLGHLCRLGQLGQGVVAAGQAAKIAAGRQGRANPLNFFFRP